MKSTRILLACTIVFVLFASGLACTSGKCVGDICIYEGKQPPYASSEADRASIHLVENSNAADPTWQQLEAFLIADNTDKETYDLQAHACGIFAEELHNNAEAAGIRAAWVGIDFYEGGDGHALDAFNTTDRGLVYIDCTGGDNLAQYQQGESWGKAGDWDKVAYLAIGREYGTISLSAATCPGYECYEAYKQQKADFEAAWQQYCDDVQAYNDWIYGKTFHPGTADYNKAQSEKRDLDARLQALNQEGDALGAFWEPMGNVSHISIYW